MWQRMWGPERGGRQRWAWRDFRDFWREVEPELERGWWGGRGWRGGRERMERGMLRLLILDALRDGPKHGYEIIKQIEERTHGWYAPSPGTIYPTLQMLEDLGLVRSESSQERRVYHLTEAGRAEVEEHAERVQGVWARFGGRHHGGPDLSEFAFVKDEVMDLLRTTIQVAVRHGLRRDDAEALRQVRQALERCKNEIREIGARRAAGARPGPAGPAEPPGQTGERF